MVFRLQVDLTVVFIGDGCRLSDWFEEKIGESWDRYEWEGERGVVCDGCGWKNGKGWEWNCVCWW